jgi:hypothetical protein
MFRMHRAPYSKMTQIYLYHLYSRPEHPKLEATYSRPHYCHKITAVHINIAHQTPDPISCSLSQLLQMPDSFFPWHHTTSTKNMPFYMHIHFYHVSGAPFAFWEEYFHKIKVMETLNWPHNDLNTTDDNVGLRVSAPQLICRMCMGI